MEAVVDFIFGMLLLQDCDAYSGYAVVIAKQVTESLSRMVKHQNYLPV